MVFIENHILVHVLLGGLLFYLFLDIVIFNGKKFFDKKEKEIIIIVLIVIIENKSK